eukprot:761313-Hanusia_phi.AAC.1
MLVLVFLSLHLLTCPQDPRVVVSVIMKLTGGSASFASELNPDAFLNQAREFEKERSHFNSLLLLLLTSSPAPAPGLAGR